MITVHGIRTYGAWQSKLEALLRQAEPDVEVLHYKFGYFSSLEFLIPPVRWYMARQFRNFFVNAVRSVPEGSRIDVVAHSFGTYLAAKALLHIPEGRRIHTVILAGSVLQPSFPWYRVQEQGRLGRVINECGWKDSVLVLCQSTALMLGMAGRVGFRALNGHNFLNRYYLFGHGGYFDSESRFMRERWLEPLTGDAPVPPVDDRPPLTAAGGLKQFAINNMHAIKVTAALALLLALVLFPLDWSRKSDYQRRTSRLAHLTRLANAAMIPGRDPAHVSEVLHTDALGKGEVESIDHVVYAGSSNRADDPIDLKKLDEQAGAGGFLPWLRSSAEEAQHARLLHAAANRERAAGVREDGGDPARALVLYEDALRSYARIHDDDPAFGSYALCLLDYGQLLSERGQYEKAIDQFRKARSEVFPDPGPARLVARKAVPAMPASLAVDALCFEAQALRYLGRWDEAEKHLFDALRQAGSSDALLSQVWNDIGWLRMERMQVARAREAFLRARESCERLVDEGKFIYQIRLFHLDHALAMADRLCGKSDESYLAYEKLVRRLQDAMENDLQFSPKERRDLRDRLVNSLERRADVYLFARHVPSPPNTDSEARGKDKGPLIDALLVEELYERAIAQSPPDDARTRTRLRLKKVVAGFLAEADAKRPQDPDLVPTATVRPVALRTRWHKTRLAGTDPSADADLHGARRVSDYVEARRAYDSLTPDIRKGLKLYAQLAEHCAEIRCALWQTCAHTEADPEHPSVHDTVAALRAFTRDWAAQCETLDRERVEMLQVALEILLDGDRGLEPDANPDLRRQDASRLVAVMNTFTKVASQPEMQPYADRFHRIVARTVRSLDPPGHPAVAPGTLPAAPVHLQTPPLPTPPGGGRVVLHVEPVPGWAFTISRPPPLEPGDLPRAALAAKRPTDSPSIQPHQVLRPTPDDAPPPPPDNP